jgi:hypothetical protein
MINLTIIIVIIIVIIIIIIIITDGLPGKGFNFHELMRQRCMKSLQ